MEEWYFEIPVHEVDRMHVFDGRKCLGEVDEGLRFGEYLSFVLVWKQIAVLRVLQNEIYHLFFLDDVPQLDDMGMLKGGMEIDFHLEGFHANFGGDIFEVDLGYGEGYDFDGVDSIGAEMEGQLDLAKRALADVAVVNKDELIDGVEVVIIFGFCHPFLFFSNFKLYIDHYLHIINMLNLPKLRNYAQELIQKSDGVLINAFLANS